jgi:hypothetical protein
VRELTYDESPTGPYNSSNLPKSRSCIRGVSQTEGHCGGIKGGVRKGKSQRITRYKWEVRTPADAHFEHADREVAGDNEGASCRNGQAGSARPGRQIKNSLPRLDINGINDCAAPKTSLPQRE